MQTVTVDVDTSFSSASHVAILFETTATIMGAAWPALAKKGEPEYLQQIGIAFQSHLGQSPQSKGHRLEDYMVASMSVQLEAARLMWMSGTDGIMVRLAQPTPGGPKLVPLREQLSPLL